MKKFIAVILSLTFSILVFPASENVYSKDKQKAGRHYVANQILVKLKPGVAANLDGGEVPSFVADAHGLRVERLAQFDEDSEMVVELDGSISVEEAIAQLNANPNVEYAEPNYLMYAANVPNDSRFNEQWPLFNDGFFGNAGTDIGALRAWDLTTGSRDVVVAIIDTGIDLSHPDLAANAWINPGEIAGNGIDDDSNGYVDDINGYDFANNTANVFENAATDWHGTHVSGTVGAVGNNGIGTAGVAWNVKLMSLKFLSARSGSSDNAVRAVKYVIDMKRRGVNVRVINASWSGPNGTRLLFRAIRKAGLEGVLFVCAAGNGGDDNRGDNIDIDEETQYPAAWSEELDSVISVAALDSRDQIPSFSNYGRKRVTVAAPGASVLSTYPGGAYTVSSGTSMATPHVSGVAALVWSYHPSLAPAQVKKRLYETAEQVLPFASKATSPGRVNAYNAIMAKVPLPHWKPKIRTVVTTSRRVIIDGLGIMRNSAFVEVNGVTLPYPRFDPSYILADGTLTQMAVKLSKAEMDAFFPIGRAVGVVIFNPSSNERSISFIYTRR